MLNAGKLSVRWRRQGGYTLFDIFILCGALVGGIEGASNGFEYFGLFGGIVAAAAGGCAGFLVGKLPWALLLAWMRRSLNRESSQRLRERVRRGREYFMSHLLLAELMRRGEDVSGELPAILELLRSGSADHRRFGWGALIVAFPHYAAQIPEYQPSAATELCRSVASRLGPGSLGGAAESSGSARGFNE